MLQELVGLRNGSYRKSLQEANPFAGIIQIKFTGISQINHLTVARLKTLKHTGNRLSTNRHHV